MTEAAVSVGVSRRAGYVWFAGRGGVAPEPAVVSGRYLSLVEREEIAVGLAAGLTQAVIARSLGRARSTISREVIRNGRQPRQGVGVGYRAVLAQGRAQERARRPKLGKLAGCARLRQEVEDRLRQRWSPVQISHHLVRAFPAQEEMRVSHEAIYQALYVQGRGALRRELAACLRTGRALRKPHSRGVLSGHGRIPEMVMITDRPKEAEDRAVPGHWEGDLIIGKNSGSAIGTLVERTTRYVLLLHLPGDHTAETVRVAMITAMASLPAHLWRSLTWDQGREMSAHRTITADTGLPIYFCDPHSPWQRGTNENTNGLLRQYFPKGTDLSVHSPEHLAFVAAQLKGRPRQTLDWATPAEALNQLLSKPFDQPGVATTP